MQRRQLVEGAEGLWLQFGRLQGGRLVGLRGDEEDGQLCPLKVVLFFGKRLVKSSTESLNFQDYPYRVDMCDALKGPCIGLVKHETGDVAEELRVDERYVDVENVQLLDLKRR